MTPEQIARINELARKQKNAPLTEEELIEQAELRRAYLAAVKANMKAQLDAIKPMPTHTKNCTCGCHHKH
ncbi:DUF896 domain-containing protein [Azotosporobacter soli]|uniref:DUF896 domain-containing protein n=1 Tax=Azotosporobacter soli TaxID=3055040 RepID=UPI0031FF4107